MGIIIRGDTAIENETYTFIIGPQRKSEAGFVLGMYAQSSLDINDDKDTNVVYVGTSLVTQYKY